ncbi:hypothetical protein [Nonomuraea salmonea]|uniref:hypothetical protein n=1 Tax=Nonomuraea salmonea TaxID=46181 RepID=UPI002FE7DB30
MRAPPAAPASTWSAALPLTHSRSADAGSRVASGAGSPVAMASAIRSLSGPAASSYRPGARGLRHAEPSAITSSATRSPPPASFSPSARHSSGAASNATDRRASGVRSPSSSRATVSDSGSTGSPPPGVASSTPQGRRVPAAVPS